MPPDEDQPRRWYSASVARQWSPKDGVNAAYVEEIERVRRTFYLAKVRRGVDEPIDPTRWIPYQILGEQVIVKLARFRWGTFSGGGVFYGNGEQAIEYNAPIFEVFLQVRQVTEPITDRLVDWGGHCFFDSLGAQPPAIISCPYRYPRDTALVHIVMPPYQPYVDAEKYHWFQSGQLCLMASPNDWSQGKRHLVTMIEAILQWIVWMYLNHPNFVW